MTALTLAACGSTDSPAPNASSTSRAPRTASTEQIYATALARWTEYEKQSEPFFATGKYTPAAKKFFAKYWTSPGPAKVPATYQTHADADLRQDAANDVRVIGLPTVKSSTGLTLKPSYAVIEQCVDYDSQKTIQDGKVRAFQGAGVFTRRITLNRGTDLYTAPVKPSQWLISSLDGVNGSKPC